VTAATQARPVIRMTRVTFDMLAAQWERLGHAYNQGLVDEEAIWRAVDVLAPGLAEEDRTFWFEQLYTALADRDGDVDLGAVPLDERDPDRLEADALRRIDEAIGALIDGRLTAMRAELETSASGGAR